MKVLTRENDAPWWKWTEEPDFTHGLYSDNTPYFKSPFTKISGSHLRVVMDSPTEFNLAMMVGDYLVNAGPNNNVHLVMPFAPGARQDRRNKTGDVLFAAKYYANIINSIGFDKVTIVDPHSEVMPALINSVQIVTAGDVILNNKKVLRTYDGVIAPDAGAAKRAYGVAEVLGVPVYQAWKHRNVANGALEGFGCQPLCFGTYLMVDDICDGGGTFMGLASHIQETDGRDQEIVLDLYVTHGIFQKGLRDLKTKFGQIITTDSLGQYESPDVLINLIDMIG